MTDTADWQGRVGDVWATEWLRVDRSFAALTPHLIAAILTNVCDGDRVLDIGCGAGEVTAAVARARPAATTLGVDLSLSLIDVARGRFAADAGAPRWTVGDAVEVAEIDGPFDLFVSRHGVMFFPDPVAAFTRLRAAARPGAGLVFSCFGSRKANRFATLADELGGTPVIDPTRDAPGPFAFADPARVATLLARSGWNGTATAIDFAYCAGQGVDPVADAAAFLSRIGPVASVLRAAAPNRREELERRLIDLLTPYRRANAVDLPARAWLWQARAGETP